MQEFFQERWQKLVVPKLQEDAKLSRGEEDQLRGRKASAARHAAEAAAKETACRLVAHLDELHEQLGQLRVQVRWAVGCMAFLAAAFQSTPSGTNDVNSIWVDICGPQLVDIKNGFPYQRTRSSRG